MKRRDLIFTGTAAAAAAGLAATAAAQTVPAVPKISPSIFDFGAKGDGVTDDSAAFSNALQVAAAEARKVIVPGYVYAIYKTVTYVSVGNVGRQWGLQGEGAVIQSKITSGADVVSITSNHIVRYFNMTGLTIKGTKTDRNGLRIACLATGGKYFYNFILDNLAIEGAGQHDLLIEGNVFEGQISKSFFQDAGKNGVTLAHSQGGVVSSINITSCYFNQNAQYGLHLANFDSQYGGPTDVRVYGGYCRENKSYGFYLNNGNIPGSSIQQVGFENNCKSLAAGDTTGAHVFGRSQVHLRDCMGYNETGGATYLVRGYMTALTTLTGCRQGAGGAVAATGKSRVIEVSGSSAAHIVLHGCNGGLAVASGNAASWQAYNCSGPSPLGNLPMKGTLASA